MKRAILKTLSQWQHSPTRMPLLLRGARQIGKTHSVRTFAKANFKHFCEINFELSPRSCQYFSDLNPKKIISEISLEVKAGVTGRLKSLRTFMQQKQIELGVRISQRPLSLENNILSIPGYLVHRLPELVREAYVQIEN